MTKNKIDRKKNWITTADRFVCFMDIMGFKDMVMRNSHETIYNMLAKLAKHRKLLENSQYPEDLALNPIKIVSFSDSIVIFTKDNSVDSFEILSSAISYLFSNTLSLGIPIKGALSYGTMSVNTTDQVFFGQPLIDAFLLQEDLYYYGIILHHTVEEYLNNNNDILEIVRNRFFDWNTPLKSGNINHMNIDWVDFLNSNNSQDKKLLALNIMKKQREITSGKPRKYIDNTIKMIEEKYNR